MIDFYTSAELTQNKIRILKKKNCCMQEHISFVFVVSFEVSPYQYDSVHYFRAHTLVGAACVCSKTVLPSFVQMMVSRRGVHVRRISLG